MARYVDAKHSLTPTARAEMMAPLLIGSSPVTGPAMIDVLALGLLYAPMLLALFDDARVVYVRRDADDTLLTAATQAYLAPEIAPYLLKPTDARRLLERFEGCWSALRGRLEARAHTVNYESLFHAEANVHTPAWRGLTRFLGTPDVEAPAAVSAYADDESRYQAGHARHYASCLR